MQTGAEARYYIKKPLFYPGILKITGKDHD